MYLLKFAEPDVALNLIGRRVSLELLKSQVTTLNIRLLQAVDGEEVREEVLQVNELLTIVMVALAQMEYGGELPFRVIRGAQSALVDVSRDMFLWRKRHAVPVDLGLQYALPLAFEIPPRDIQKAWREMIARGL